MGHIKWTKKDKIGNEVLVRAILQFGNNKTVESFLKNTTTRLINQNDNDPNAIEIYCELYQAELDIATSVYHATELA